MGTWVMQLKVIKCPITQKTDIDINLAKRRQNLLIFAESYKTFVERIEVYCAHGQAIKLWHVYTPIL